MIIIYHKNGRLKIISQKLRSIWKSQRTWAIRPVHGTPGTNVPEGHTGSRSNNSQGENNVVDQQIWFLQYSLQTGRWCGTCRDHSRPRKKWSGCAEKKIPAASWKNFRWWRHGLQISGQSVPGGLCHCTAPDGAGYQLRQFQGCGADRQGMARSNLYHEV